MVTDRNADVGIRSADSTASRPKSLLTGSFRPLKVLCCALARGNASVGYGPDIERAGGSLKSAPWARFEPRLELYVTRIPCFFEVLDRLYWDPVRGRVTGLHGGTARGGVRMLIAWAAGKQPPRLFQTEYKT